MKKAFITMMVLATAIQGWAQTDVQADVQGNVKSSNEKRLTLIPKVGVCWSTVSMDSWVGKGAISKPNVSGMVGPVGGVEAEYMFSSRIGAGLGVFYAMQGRKYDDIGAYEEAVRRGMLSGMTNATKNSERHHYILVPLTAKCYLVDRLAINAGVQLGILFRKSGSQEWPYDDNFEHKIGNSPNKLDFSIPVGLSYDFSYGLQFDLRYNHGLKKISSSQGMIEEKNRVVMFTVGYRLPLL